MTVKVVGSHGLLPFGWMLTTYIELCILDVLIPIVMCILLLYVVQYALRYRKLPLHVRYSMTVTVISQNRYEAYKLSLFLHSNDALYMIEIQAFHLTRSSEIQC